MIHAWGYSYIMQSTMFSSLSHETELRARLLASEEGRTTEAEARGTALPEYGWLNMGVTMDAVEFQVRPDQRLYKKLKPTMNKFQPINLSIQNLSLQVTPSMRTDLWSLNAQGLRNAVLYGISSFVGRYSFLPPSKLFLQQTYY